MIPILCVKFLVADIFPGKFAVLNELFLLILTYVTFDIFRGMRAGRKEVLPGHCLYSLVVIRRDRAQTFVRLPHSWRALHHQEYTLFIGPYACVIRFDFWIPSEYPGS